MGDREWAKGYPIPDKVFVRDPRMYGATWDRVRCYPTCVEYVRADLCATLEAERVEQANDLAALEMKCADLTMENAVLKADLRAALEEGGGDE